MKNHRTIRIVLTALTLLPLLLSLALAGCRSRTDQSEGTVLMTVTDFAGLPSVVSLSSQDPPFVIGTLTVRNIAKDPTGTTSNLQSIELRTVEFRYVRRDTGTRIPPSNVQAIFGLVPQNGTTTLSNTPFLTSDQVLSQPLKDLLDFGRDTETGTSVVVLDVSMRIFGRTLSGDEIATDTSRFTIEVRP
jgi:hypothetical protein